MLHNLKNQDVRTLAVLKTRQTPNPNGSERLLIKGEDCRLVKNSNSAAAKKNWNLQAIDAQHQRLLQVFQQSAYLESPFSS